MAFFSGGCLFTKCANASGEYSCLWYTVVIEIIQIIHCKSGLLAKCTNQTKVIEITTQQMFQVASPNSTENTIFNDFCCLKIIQPLHGKHL